MSVAVTDYVVLEAPSPASGCRRCRAWDPRLEREVELSWLPSGSNGATDPSVDDRVRRWASVEHLGVAAVLARGTTPIAAGFVVSAAIEGPSVAELGPRAITQIDRLASLVATLQELAGVGLVPASLTEGVRLSPAGIPTIVAPRLDRDAEPGEALGMVQALVREASPGRGLAQAIAGAEDLATVATLLAHASARARWPNRALGVIAGLVVSVAAVRSWRAPSPDAAPLPTCAEVVAERTAPTRHWFDGNDPLQAWLDAWSVAAASTCELGRRETGSAALVTARRSCEDELLAAADGVALALVGSGPSTLPITQLLPPADACAWTPEDHARRQPWVERPVAREQIVALARARTAALLGHDVPSSAEHDALPPRWRAWAEHVAALEADSAAAWRQASWRRFTAHVEAGDDLAALDALLDRLEGAAAWELDLGPSTGPLIPAFITRLEGTHVDDPRLERWLEARQDRLERAGLAARR